MQNFIPINIVIGDRTYRIKVDTKDEETVRKMSKQLNERLATYKIKYAGKDMQDYLAMVVLSYITEQQIGEVTAPDKTATEGLEKIESIIDKALEEE